MNIRVIGAVLIVAGCSSLGISLAASYASQERCLKELLNCLRFMVNDLQYRLTPLPELCRCTAAQSRKEIRKFFLCLSEELEDQISPDAQCCVKAALDKTKDLPDLVKIVIMNFGKELGRFDIQGQINSLENSIAECDSNLKKMDQNKEIKIRNYRTLGLCAGAALTILFI